MTWFRNLRIYAKQLVAFGIVMLATVVVGIAGLIGQQRTGAMATDLAKDAMPSAIALLDVEVALRTIQRDLRFACLTRDPDHIARWKKTLPDAKAKMIAHLAALDSLVQDPADRQILGELKAEYAAWLPAADKVIEYVDAGRMQDAQRQLVSDANLGPAARAVAAADKLLESRRAAAAIVSEKVASTGRAMMWTLSLMLLAAVGLSMLLAWGIANLIGDPMQKLGEASDRLAQGDLAGDIRSDTKDELGWVSYSMHRVVKSQRELAAAAERIAAGDTSITIKLRSEHDVLNRSFQQLQATLDSLVSEMRSLADAARHGDLSRRGDASRFQGAFRELVQGMNDTLDAVVTPVQEAADVLERVANRDLRASVEGRYEGDHAKIKDAVNGAIAAMSTALASIGESATTLAAASEELTATASQMEGNADNTSRQAGVVAAASSEVAAGVQTVAAGTEELSASIREIAKSAADAARVATEAVHAAQRTDATISKLGASSAEIGEVIRTITSIAEQTNLLALNATIEAARAGEAGKGFAVVANEVKELAKATARATEDIGSRIAAIQADTSGAVTAIRQISDIIHQISDIQTSIAGAVEEQTATTNEIARTITAAARSSSDINENIGEVARAAEDTVSGARSSLGAAHELATLASNLRSLVADFAVADEREFAGAGRR
jgi:methyl-accepting chemotaxis protein